MTVITVSRKLGSLGSKIAFDAAERLGYRVVWREWINDAARRAGAPEAALAAVDELGLLGICPSPEACQAYQQEVATVIREIADQGSVIIIGRGGQVILRNHPGIIHLHFTAPAELRATRVSERLNIPLKKAEAQIQASDNFRKQYMHKYYQVDWEDPNLYNLILNTQEFTIQQYVDIVCALVHITTHRLEHEIEHQR